MALPRTTRLAAAIVIVVAGIGLSACSSDDDGTTATSTSAPSATATSTTATSTGVVTTVPAAPTTTAAASGKVAEFTFTGGNVTGDSRVTVKLGDEVTIRVTSDVAEEVHVHTYDLTVDLEPGVRRRGHVHRRHPRGPRGRAGGQRPPPHQPRGAVTGGAPSRIRRVGLLLAATAGAWLATAAPASAHGLGGRSDLPLPVWMFAYGAAGAIIVSFAALAAFWPVARLQGGVAGVVLVPASRRRLTAGLATAGRAVGVVLFLVVLGAALFGPAEAADNLAPAVVYIAFWVGLMFVSALVGDLWRVISPFPAFAAAVDRLRGRPAADALPPRALAGGGAAVRLRVDGAGLSRPGRPPAAGGGDDRLHRGGARRGRPVGTTPSSARARPSPPSSGCWRPWPRSTPTTRAGSGSVRR